MMNPRSIPNQNWPWLPAGHTTSGAVRASISECAKLDPPTLRGSIKPPPLLASPAATVRIRPLQGRAPSRHVLQGRCLRLFYLPLRGSRLNGTEVFFRSHFSPNTVHLGRVVSIARSALSAVAAATALRLAYLARSKAKGGSCCYRAPRRASPAI